MIPVSNVSGMGNVLFLLFLVRELVHFLNDLNVKKQTNTERNCQPRCRLAPHEDCVASC